MSKSGKSGRLRIHPMAKLSTGKIGKEIIVVNSGCTIKTESSIDDSGFEVQIKGNETSVISQHSGFIASDIKDDFGRYFFYKIIKQKNVDYIEDSHGEKIPFIEDDTFIYVNSKESLIIFYKDGTVSMEKSVPIFLNALYKNSGTLYSDNKTFYIKKYYLKLKIIFNSKNISIIRDTNSGIFELNRVITIPSVAINGWHHLENSLSQTTEERLVMTNGDGNYFRFISGHSGIYSRLSFLINEETSYVEVYQNYDSIKIKEYNIREEFIGGLLDTSQYSLVFKIRIYDSVPLYATIKQENTEPQSRKCGNSMVLSDFYGYEKTDKVHISQKRFKINNIKIFDLSHFKVQDLTKLSVIDTGGQTLDYTYVDNFIYVKTESMIGIKYEDSIPDKFL